MDAELAGRIAGALELIAERLGSLETRIEELSYEIQAQGGQICEALSPTLEESEN
jgi:hypothetical protein